ncbi:MAG: hypothetical protein DRI90_10430 [Deltaproteobacteria bacterium]|nr:MAG: hypothetical protein DRI90_10430 [Deltaproteobacteria bacterium]
MGDAGRFLRAHDRERKEIRLERGIQPPRTVPLPPGVRCPKCGETSWKTSSKDPLGVSIRSALFALKKDGLINEAEFKERDKSWMKHKKKNGLDAYGRKTETARNEGISGTAPSCH